MQLLGAERKGRRSLTSEADGEQIRDFRPCLARPGRTTLGA